jgi:hypothetical protein
MTRAWRVAIGGRWRPSEALWWTTRFATGYRTAHEPGACTALDSDAKNCGACGKVCPSNQFCSAGICQTGCAAGETKCGQNGVNLASSFGKCGACGTSCKAGEACVAQVCKCQAPNLVCNGACTAVSSSVDDCGACGHKCSGGEQCRNGTCGGGNCKGQQTTRGGMCCKPNETCFFQMCAQF